MSSLTISRHCFTGSPGHYKKDTGRKIKGIQIGQEAVKLSLFADDMVMYIEYPKESRKALLEQITKFTKYPENRINIQKSVWPYISQRQTKGKQNSKNCITKAKYLRIYAYSLQLSILSIVHTHTHTIV